MATISTRITLTGGDEVKKQLEALGDAGQKSFKQIQDAARQTQVDPARFAQAQQAITQLASTGRQLANQFVQLANAATQFGTAGQQATAQVTDGLQKTSAAAGQAGESLFSAATKIKIAVVAVAGGIALLMKSLTSGAGETAKEFNDQADGLKIALPQWLDLRKAIAAAGADTDDFVKSIDTFNKATKDVGLELAQLSRVYTVARSDGSGLMDTVTVITAGMGSLTSETAKTVTELRKLGVSAGAIQSGSLATMKELAIIIGKMPDSAAKAALGIKFFGDKWQDAIKVLTGVKKAVDDESDALKQSRELTLEQVKTAKDAADAWEDLGKAFRAAKDLIGVTLAPSSQARSEWLTDLVDKSRELLKTWLGLSAEERPEFLKDLADDAPATALKVLIDLGQTLGNLWTDILVPAGESLMEAIKNLASGLGDVTTEQAIAFFIALAAAVTALAVAFKGISFVLSPITALISLFAGFGPILIPLIALVVLFWDQIKDGINAVLALIPNAINGFRQAGEALVRGDWGSAWELFKASALLAFATIRQAIAQTPMFQPIIAGLETIGQQIPGTLKLIIDGLVLLGQAAQGVANSLNKVFGTDLTGTSIAALVIIGQLTGGLQALASAAVIVGVAFTALATVVGGPVAAVIVGAGIAIAVFHETLTGWADALQAAGERLREFINAAPGNAFQWIVDSFNAAIEGVKSAANAAMQWITEWVTTPVANAWQWIVDAWNRMLGALGLGGGGSTSPDGGGGSGFAGGGLLGGRGTGTSDSNLAWVSRGEYIVPAAAVAQPGVLALLEALRHTGGNLRGLLNDMGRFAVGGLVTPAFAGGGMAGRDLGTLTLGLPGGSSVTVRASSDVVDQLRRAAAMGQVRSGGRKPSRYS